MVRQNEPQTPLLFHFRTHKRSGGFIERKLHKDNSEVIPKSLKITGSIYSFSQGMLNMAKVLIIYYSRSGNTEKMAELIVEGLKKEKNIEVKVKPVQECRVEKLLDADGIVLLVLQLIMGLWLLK